jgi:chromate transporter
MIPNTQQIKLALHQAFCNLQEHMKIHLESKPPNSDANQSPSMEVFFYFLKLGLLGFGGPLAIVSSMQRDLVEKKGWLDSDSFHRVFTLIKAMPGPVAFQTAVYLGRQRAGWRGGLLAAVGLNGPAFVMMIFFGIFYAKWREAQIAVPFMVGMQAAAIGVIATTIRNLANPHRKKILFWILFALSSLVTFVIPSMEPAIILMCGAFCAYLFHWKKTGPALPEWLKNLHLSIAPSGDFLRQKHEAIVALVSQPNYGELIWCCFKSGAFVFGSGLAIVPLMEHDFVNRLHWLTHQEFMDALAFGQVTPGPVVITATFIGYKSLGMLGAFAATVGIFAAPFFHMMTWFPKMNQRLSQLSWISAFLTGTTAAVAGSITTATYSLIGALDIKVIAIPIIIATIGTAIYSKIPAWAIIPIGGLVAFLASLIL